MKQRKGAYGRGSQGGERLKVVVGDYYWKKYVWGKNEGVTRRGRKGFRQRFQDSRIKGTRDCASSKGSNHMGNGSLARQLRFLPSKLTFRAEEFQRPLTKEPYCLSHQALCLNNTHVYLEYPRF